jgi:hypothetical protein
MVWGPHSPFDAPCKGNRHAKFRPSASHGTLWRHSKILHRCVHENGARRSDDKRGRRPVFCVQHSVHPHSSPRASLHKIRVYPLPGYARRGIRAPAPTWSRVAPQRVGASNSQLAGGMETASYPSTMRDECITLHTTAPAEGSGLFRSIEPDFHLGLTPRSKVLLYSYLRPPSNPIPNLDIKTSVTSAHSLVTGFGLWIALQ